MVCNPSTLLIGVYKPCNQVGPAAIGWIDLCSSQEFGPWCSKNAPQTGDALTSRRDERDAAAQKSGGGRH
jgi:hypothetical protein